MAFGSSRGKGTRVKTMWRLGRLFDGWQAGLIVIVTAALVAMLVVPRPVLPDAIPLPQPNWRVLREGRAQEEARWLAAEREPLPYEVRAVGDAFRRLGDADARGDAGAQHRMRATLAHGVPAALRNGPEPMLRLRAFQTEAFLRALSAFESTGVPSQEIHELAGNFIRTAYHAGWMRTRAGHPHLIAGEVIRRILFRKRWNEATGLHEASFALSLDEERAFHAFLFQHPIAHLPKSNRHDRRMRCRLANEYLLRHVTAFGRLDPSYPTGYARGILLLRLDRPQAALAPLVRFVESHPNGPHTLRARNTLRYAQQKMHELLIE